MLLMQLFLLMLRRPWCEVLPCLLCIAKGSRPCCLLRLLCW
jgi:hypothetical protein